MKNKEMNIILPLLDKFGIECEINRNIKNTYRHTASTRATKVADSTQKEYDYLEFDNQYVYDSKGNILSEGAKYRSFEIWNIYSIPYTFAESVQKIERFIELGAGRKIMAQVGYELPKGATVKLNSLKILNASNFAEPNQLTSKKPIQKDKGNDQSGGLDRHVWYKMNFTINGIKVTVPWRYNSSYGLARNAAENGAADHAYYMDMIIYKASTARALGLLLAKNKKLADRIKRKCERQN